MNLWSVRRSGSGDRGKTRAWSNARTSGGGIAVTMLMTPLSTNYCKRHGRWAKEVVRDGGSVDEVMRDGGDWVKGTRG